MNSPPCMRRGQRTWTRSEGVGQPNGVKAAGRGSRMGSGLAGLPVGLHSQFRFDRSCGPRGLAEIRNAEVFSLRGGADAMHFSRSSFAEERRPGLAVLPHGGRPSLRAGRPPLGVHPRKADCPRRFGPLNLRTFAPLPAVQHRVLPFLPVSPSLPLSFFRHSAIPP